MADAPILAVRGLKKYYGGSSNLAGGIRAVDGVDFTVASGETLAIVGESGSGKSTVGRCLLGLAPITAGEVVYAGRRIDNLSPRAFRPFRRHIQVIFQDPFSSLDPRWTVRRILAEPLVNFGMAKGRAGIDSRVAELLDKVGLPRDSAGRYPHEFSGGQRQRIGIARALASEPNLIVCDEAVSALDVSVKAQIINLFAALQKSMNLSLVFISHDLAVVEHLAHRVAVMYLGRIVEIGAREEIFAAPRHPYTEALLSSVPSMDPDAKQRRILLRGDIPSPVNPPSGCRFRTRCRHVFERCATEEPELRSCGGSQLYACHLDRGRQEATRNA
jgi:peptide/nickel transport system ATP-binding protein